MDLLNFIFVILAGVGLSHILADGSIVSGFKIWLSKRKNWLCRKTLQMLNCYQCNGFWSGIIVSVCATYGIDWLLWAFVISIISPLFGFLKLWLAMMTSTDNFGDNSEEQDDAE